MSLMHLLAVGRSIWSIRDKPSPFKMTQQSLNFCERPRSAAGRSD